MRKNVTVYDYTEVSTEDLLLEINNNLLTIICLLLNREHIH